MAKRRKTSITPKRKIFVPKPPPPRPKYPDHIEDFIAKVEALVPGSTLSSLKVRVDRYDGSSTYEISVMKHVLRGMRCLWAAHGDKKEDLDLFFESEAYRHLNI